MVRVFRFTVLIAGLLASSLLAAQQDTQSPHVEATMTTADKPEPAAPKVQAHVAAAKPTPTPLTEDQQLGRQMLEASEAAARGLEPPMRTYSLLQIAQAYLPSDKAKAAGLLRDAFTAATAIPDDKDKQQTKSDLQESILRALLPISQSDVEERLLQADLSVRKRLSSAIINLDARNKQFDSAIQLVNRLTGEDEFPYASGIELMNAMTPEMSGEKQELFAQATSSYSQHTRHGMRLGSNFSDLVVRFGPSMPPKLALEAIDEILKQAKEANEPFTMTLTSDAGTASFDSSYEYALFSVLPLLRQLDESRAKSLLEENQSLQAKFQQFPQGLQSLNPELANPAKAGDSSRSADSSKNGDPAKRRGLSYMMRSGKAAPGQAAQDYQRAEVQRNVQQVIDSSEKDPEQAIAQAGALPASSGEPLPQSPRGRALEAIAKANLKDHPAIAKQATDELRKMAEDLSGEAQAMYLASAANLYLQLGDNDTAERVVSAGFKAAEKMLEEDANADDPNTALKAWWPSTDAYRRFVEIETKISHRSTANILKEIKDSEIRTVESIMVARTLLGVPMAQFTIARSTKSGKNGFMMSASTTPAP
jgi:hypothetical protein